jgi:hypothetical protein
MNLEKIMAVSGLPGLYKLVTSRSNGILVEEFDTDKTRFLSMRKHQFTPLQTVAIYTDEDATELTEVFKTMIAKSDKLPVPSASENSNVLFEYFAQILPEYDRDRVMISDIKKVLKWYSFLLERDLLKETEASSEEE